VNGAVGDLPPPERGRPDARHLPVRVLEVQAPVERAFRVLAYEPPHRVCFSWNVNLHWQLETNKAKTSEVEVTFTPDGPERTRVMLTHRHLDRHGDGWESMRDAVGSGWSLTHFAEIAAQH